MLGVLLVFSWYFSNREVIFKITNRLKVNNNNNFKSNGNFKSHITVRRTSRELPVFSFFFYYYTNKINLNFLYFKLTQGDLFSKKKTQGDLISFI
jgi:hypothetical protein